MVWVSLVSLALSFSTQLTAVSLSLLLLSSHLNTMFNCKFYMEKVYLSLWLTCWMVSFFSAVLCNRRFLCHTHHTAQLSTVNTCLQCTGDETALQADNTSLTAQNTYTARTQHVVMRATHHISKSHSHKSQTKVSRKRQSRFRLWCKVWIWVACQKQNKGRFITFATTKWDANAMRQSDRSSERLTRVCYWRERNDWLTDSIKHSFQSKSFQFLVVSQKCQVLKFFWTTQ